MCGNKMIYGQESCSQICLEKHSVCTYRKTNLVRVNFLKNNLKDHSILDIS